MQRTDLARVMVGFLSVAMVTGCLAPPRPRRVPPKLAPATPASASSPAPIASPTATAASSLLDAAEADGGEATAEEADVLAVEPESLLTRIDATTPPNVAAALRMIEEGRDWMQRQEQDRAQDRFERALAIDPSNPYGYYFLAQLHFETQGYDQAIAFAEKAAVLSARSDPVWTARAFALQGAVFEQAGRYRDAREAYRKALAADARSLPARSGAARLGNSDAEPSLRLGQ
jgi:tetratricopeptide (TPR) repeat protein